VKEIVPGIWRWTAPHPEWRTAHEWGHEVACFALELPAELVLVDPLVPADSSHAASVWSTLDRLAEGKGSVHVMVTIPYHARSSEAIRGRYRGQAEVGIWGHPAVARRLGARVPLNEIEPGKPLPVGAQAIAIGNPRRQEMPLYFPSHRALAFGDSIVGVDGTLRVWELLGDERRRRWYRSRFLPSLEPLLQFDVAHALVTHGPAVVDRGNEELARALVTEPWNSRQASTA